MQKIPMPLAIAAVVVIVLLAGFMVFRNANKTGGDSGDPQAITSDIMKNNPKNAPEMPADLKPSAMAVSAGHGKKQ